MPTFGDFRDPLTSVVYVVLLYAGYNVEITSAFMDPALFHNFLYVIFDIIL